MRNSYQQKSRNQKLLRRTMAGIVHVLASLFLCVAVSGCQDKLEEYYEVPDWISGSVADVLQQRNGYSQFLRALQRCDYGSLIEGRSIMTVMAPDDPAMNSYLLEHFGTTNVDEVPLAELRKLVGFHVLYYAFDRQKLTNFRPDEGDGAPEEQQNVNAGLYFKFRTHSQDAPTREVADRIYQGGVLKDTTGLEVDVYHLERFVPIFSYRMFQTKGIDAKRNYEYFFGEGTWRGDNGFNVAGAGVDEYEVITKNGYIYFIDRVLEPLETLRNALLQDGHYQLYLKFYDAYDYFLEDAKITQNYGEGNTTYYLRGYRSQQFQLVNIDNEWPTSSYSDVTTLASVAYSVFAPTDEALATFYTQYWGDEGTGYPKEVSYDSVSSDAIVYLVSNSISGNFSRRSGYINYLAFPSEIESGAVTNAYTGAAISFPVDEVPQENRRMCVNGVLYGLTKVTPPAIFGSVTGPAYKYKKYNLFLQMLSHSGLASTLSNGMVNYIAFYPKDAQFLANNIWQDESIASGIRVGTHEVSYALPTSSQSAFINAHMIDLGGEAAQPLPTSGIHVYRTLASDRRLYVYLIDGRVTNSYLWNQLIEYESHIGVREDSLLSPFSLIISKGEPWSNGLCYEYDTDNKGMLLYGDYTNQLNPSFLDLMYAHRNDAGTLFGGFANLLQLAGMTQAGSSEIPLMTEVSLLLVPTTEVLQQAILEDRLPFIATTATSVDDPDFWNCCSVVEGKQKQLQHYLMQYFVPNSTSPSVDYPYPGFSDSTWKDSNGNLQNAYPSMTDQSTTPVQQVYLHIVDNGDGSLSVWPEGQQKPVSVISRYHCLPFVFDDAAVHFLDGVFENQWPNNQ